MSMLFFGIDGCVPQGACRCLDGSSTGVPVAGSEIAQAFSLCKCNIYPRDVVESFPYNRGGNPYLNFESVQR